jgi:hypothetical protein
MQGVFLAAPAILVEFQAVGIVAAVLLGGVVAFFALRARKVNHHPHIFLCHFNLDMTQPGPGTARPRQMSRLV